MRFPSISCVCLNCKPDSTGSLVWVRVVQHGQEFASHCRLRFKHPDWPHSVSLECPARAGSLRSPVLDMNSYLAGAAFLFGATSHQTRKEFTMARSNTAPAQETNPPDFLAWHVANKGDRGFWTRIGAAWFHRDRRGLSLQLEVVPINGRIVLRTPLDDEKKEPGA